MALPDKLKSLIDKYCMGVAPSDEQMDEIFNMAGLLNADSAEVSDYIQKMISGPTKKEREEAARKAEEAARKKQEEAARKKQEEAARKKQEEAERKKQEEAARKAEEKAARKSGFLRRIVLLAVVAAVVFLIISKCTGGKDTDNQVQAPVSAPVEAMTPRPEQNEQPVKVEESRQPENRPQVVPKESSGQSTPASSSGSCKYGAGTYYGTVTAGKPADGKGTIRYPDGGLVDSRDPKQTQANPGDYVEGFFKNGRLVQGYLYSGGKKIAIMIGE